MRKESGFSVIESLIILVIIAIIGVVGYLVWSNVSNSSTKTTNTAGLNYKSPSVNVAQVPTVNNATDLKTALSTVNQMNLQSSTTDSSQLTNQVNSF